MAEKCITFRKNLDYIQTQQRTMEKDNDGVVETKEQRIYTQICIFSGFVNLEDVIIHIAPSATSNLILRTKEVKCVLYNMKPSLLRIHSHSHFALSQRQSHTEIFNHPRKWIKIRKVEVEADGELQTAPTKVN